jgi:ribose transport system substrate-binding protein
MHIKKLPIKNIIGSSAVALTAVALAACSSSGSSSPGGTSSAAAVATSTSTSTGGGGGKALTIDYAAPVMAETGVQDMVAGMKAAAALNGSKITAYDSNVESSVQITNMQTMLQQNPNIIGTWTLDPGATAGIYHQIESASIPLIGVNSSDNGITHSVWYDTELCSANGPWAQTAQMIAKKYPGGTVITLGLDGVPSIDTETSCFTTQAKKLGLKVIAHASNTTDNASGGQQLTATLLAKYPKVDAIWAYNDNTALGASAAVIAAGGKVSDGTSAGVIITGANGDTDAIQAVQQGRLTATWDSDNVEFGWLFVKMAEELAAGDAPSEMVLKTTLIDKATAGSWVTPLERKVTFASLDYTTVK